MMTKTLLTSALITVATGAVALAGDASKVASPPPHRDAAKLTSPPGRAAKEPSPQRASMKAPTPDQIVAGRGKDARKLLAEVLAARAAISRDEPAAARALVNDAIALDTTFAGGPQYAVVESGTGTLAAITSTKDVPVVGVFDRLSETVLLDLHATHADLLQARTALEHGKLASANRDLAQIGRSVRIEESLTPEPGSLAAANLRLALLELSAGEWHDAGIAMEAALHDAKLASGAPPTGKSAPSSPRGR